jgi:hypothetical protein
MMRAGEAVIQSRRRHHSNIMFHHFRGSASLNPAGVADGFGEPSAFFTPGSIALHFGERHGQARRPILITSHPRDIKTIFQSEEVSQKKSSEPGLAMEQGGQQRVPERQVIGRIRTFFRVQPGKLTQEF